MTECPNCKTMIDDNLLGKPCAQCGCPTYSPQHLEGFAMSRIRFMIKHGTYNQLLQYVLDNDIESATEFLRRGWKNGRKDIMLERAIIDKIKNGPSHLRKYRPVDNVQVKEQPVLSPKPTVTLIDCPACHKQISSHAESCIHCGHPTGVHVCPKCQSINTKVISGVSKAGSIFLWGVFAANKVVSKFECKDCGHKW